MAGQHVGEQAHRMAERPGEERDHLDRHHQRQDVDRHAGRHEQLEEAEAVLVDSHDDHGEEHHQRHRRGDDDVAGDGEGIGEQPDQIADQDEHEQAEHHREEAHALLARRRAQHAGDELVGELRRRLQPAGNARAAARARRHHQAGDGDRDQHVKRGIGQREIVSGDPDRDEWRNRELFDRIDRRSRFACHV